MHFLLFGIFLICSFAIGQVYNTSEAKNIKGSNGLKFCGSLLAIANAKIVYTEDTYSTYAEVTCNQGYKNEGESKIRCEHRTGFWVYQKLPNCTLINPCSLPKFHNGDFTKSNQTAGVQYCYTGYYISTPDGRRSLKSASVYCPNGRWKYLSNNQEVTDCVLDCGSPPTIQSGSYKFRDGAQGYYSCERGYGFLEGTPSYLTCINGEWRGKLPECLSSSNCLYPPEIDHARWSVRRSNPWTGDIFTSGFPSGTKVQYDCLNVQGSDTQYQLIGEQMIECVNGAWPKKLPQCVDIADEMLYCQMPSIPNGECQCLPGGASCSVLITGSQIECTCQEGYEAVGQQVLSCNRGQWQKFLPTCIAPTYKSDEISTNNNVNDQGHMNTLAIVIATACSVLGFLLMVMVVVVLRRRKPHHPRIYHTGAMPPPYTRVHSNSADEHDRVALIGYERARLPTYEEATRTTRPSRSNEGHTTSSEYRPLPNIPSQLSAAIQSNNNNNNLDNTSRQSVITTSTVNRDGTSEIFGSIDTVNFSMSDASTSVTVDTLDSRASRPSNASRTATAGSLESSRENLTTEDAPLLKNTVGEEDVMTVPAADELEIRIEEEAKEA